MIDLLIIIRDSITSGPGLFFSGIIASGLGYIATNFFILPYRRFKETKAKIGRELLYYAHAITSPQSGLLADEAQPVIRRLAVELEEKYLLLPMKRLVPMLIPSKKDVKEAKGSLIRISNNLRRIESVDMNLKDLQQIYTNLNINELEEIIQELISDNKKNYT